MSQNAAVALLPSSAVAVTPSWNSLSVEMMLGVGAPKRSRVEGSKYSHDGTGACEMVECKVSVRWAGPEKVSGGKVNSKGLNPAVRLGRGRWRRTIGDARHAGIAATPQT